jgi:hypothetical protein
VDGNEVAGKAGTGYFWHKTGTREGFCKHGDESSNAVK